MKKIFYISVFFIFTSCLNNTPSNKISENFDYGNTEKGVYTNNFFGLKILFNTSWNLQSQEQFNTLASEGLELISGDNKELQRTIKASEITSANLFAILKYKDESAITFNPSFMSAAENLKGVTQIKTGADYLKSTQDLLKQGQINYSFDAIEAVSINEVHFYKMNIEAYISNTTIKQEMYVTLRNNFSLIFSITYNNENDKKELHKIINSITFTDTSI